jgi:Uma2 family endonuclease
MQVVERLTPAELQGRWAAVMADEELADYVGRAEVDPYGEIVLTPPPSLVHQRIANHLAAEIQAQLGGSALVECPVVVDGVLIADVAWISGERAAGMRTPAATAPEIVVEVASPRNTRRGLRSKAARFLAHGVQEVVLVELDGTFVFIGQSGEAAASTFRLELTLPPNSYPL